MGECYIPRSNLVKFALVGALADIISCDCFDFGWIRDFRSARVEYGHFLLPIQVKRTVYYILQSGTAPTCDI
jgi:hypothetical protein